MDSAIYKIRSVTHLLKCICDSAGVGYVGSESDCRILISKALICGDCRYIAAANVNCARQLLEVIAPSRPIETLLKSISVLTL